MINESKKNPLVSVIIPVFNVENYIGKCIDSVLEQSYKNFEILLVDDGSTDKSAHICDEYQNSDTRIKVIHKSNGGPSSARNYGIDNASGQYVIFIDSDDFWMDKEILKQFVEIALTDNLDVVRGEYMRVDERGKEIKTDIDSTSSKTVFAGHTFSSFEMIKKIIDREFFPVLFFYSKKSIANIRFDEGRIFLEDMDFAIKYFSTEKKCSYLPIKFYAYRQRYSSITNEFRMINITDAFSLNEVFYRYSAITKNKRLAEHYVFMSIMMYYWTLKTVASKEYFPRYKEIDRIVNLSALHKEIHARIHLTSKKYPIELYLPPYLGIQLIHLRWFIYKILKSLRLK